MGNTSPRPTRSSLFGKSDLVVRGPIVDIKLPDTTMGQMFLDGLRKADPKFVVMIEGDSGRTITAKDAMEQSISLAQGFGELGVKKLERIAVIATNGIEANIALIATSIMGAVLCPLDPSCKISEYKHYLKCVQPKVIVCEETIQVSIEKAMEQANCKSKLVVIGGKVQVRRLHSMPNIFNKGENIISYNDLASKIPRDEEIKSFSVPSVKNLKITPYMVIFTSGTTSLSKGVELSQYGCMYQCFICRKLLGTGLTLQVSFLYWIAGIMVFLPSIINGMQRILVKNNTVVNILRAIDKYKPTQALLPPNLLQSIARSQDLSKFDLTSVTVIVSEGSSIPKRVVEETKEVFYRAKMLQAYGCTELGGACTLTNASVDACSVGILVPNVKAKVIHCQSGDPLGPNEEGELYIMSPAQMIGYHGNKDATKHALTEDGWFKTGDICYYTPKGVFYITGKVSDLVQVDGHEISPLEIEAVILGITGVKDVAIVPIKIGPNTLLMALVAKNPNTANLKEDTIEKTVASQLTEFKHLRGGVAFIKEIPRSKAGKLIRRDLLKLGEDTYASKQAQVKSN